MASSRAEAWRRLTLLCMALACIELVFALACPGLASAAQLRPDDTIKLSADSMRIDYDSHTLKVTNVNIANQQGTMLIRAREARAHGVELSFSNSQWDFSGDVHIEVDGAILDANTATVNFKGNLDSAQVAGNPATFSHPLKGGTQRNQGHAGTIDYDARKGQVHLSGGAWYTDGRNEFNSPTLAYNLADRSLEHKVVPGERVQMIIRPGTGSAPATPPPATSPPATSPPATSPPATTAPQK